MTQHEEQFINHTPHRGKARQDRTTPLARATEIAGGVVRLSEKLGVKHQAISQWKKIPASRVLDIERLTGVSRYDQRPDIFGSKEPE